MVVCPHLGRRGRLGAFRFVVNRVYLYNLTFFLYFLLINKFLEFLKKTAAKPAITMPKPTMAAKPAIVATKPAVNTATKPATVAAKTPGEVGGAATGNAAATATAPPAKPSKGAARGPVKAAEQQAVLPDDWPPTAADESMCAAALKGRVPRKACEAALRLSGQPGDFILRESETDVGSFSITMLVGRFSLGGRGKGVFW